MKYARLERERRYLLAGPPEPGTGSVPVAIHDRYLRGTRLRLRLVEQAGQPPVRKLGQKVPVSGWAVAHTSLYLDAAEYELLAALPADELRKTRTTLDWDGRCWAVDCFTGPLAGLVLAEVELAAAEPATDVIDGIEPGIDTTEPADGIDTTEPAGRWPPPALAVLAEVTADQRFTGAALARTSAADLSRLLARP